MTYFENEMNRIKANPNAKKVLEYIKERQARGYKDRSHLFAIRVLLRITDFINKPIETATKEDVRDFINSLNSYKDITLEYTKSNLKAFFKWLNNGKEPECTSWYKIRRIRNKLESNDILTPEEVAKIISVAESIKHKCVISLLYELGCRAVELCWIKLKDINFQKDCAIITIHNAKMKPNTNMKSTRLLVVNQSLPYLKKYLETHPNPKDKEAFLFTNEVHKEKGNISPLWVWKIVKYNAGLAKINKRVFAHLLRHSRLSQLAQFLTDSELKQFSGWTLDSNMPSTYLHLNDNSIVNKLKQINGLEPIEKTNNPILIRCSNCNEVNPINLNFCESCGNALSERAQNEIKVKETELKNRLDKLEGLYQQIATTLITSTQPNTMDSAQVEFNQKLAKEIAIVSRKSFLEQA